MNVPFADASNFCSVASSCCNVGCTSSGAFGPPMSVLIQPGWIATHSMLSRLNSTLIALVAAFSAAWNVGENLSFIWIIPVGYRQQEMCTFDMRYANNPPSLSNCIEPRIELMLITADRRSPTGSLALATAAAFKSGRNDCGNKYNI